MEEVDLTPFKTMDISQFQKVYKGVLDEKGRMSQAVNKDLANCEFYVFVKKCENKGD